MPLRLILILTLLVQQLALPAAVSAALRNGSCLETSCCQVVETTSCCGETVRETRCGRTGGRECLCGLGPGDCDPAPETPRPADRNEIAPAPAALAARGIDRTAPLRSLVPPAAPAVVRTHNEVRALLCIWRT